MLSKTAQRLFMELGEPVPTLTQLLPGIRIAQLINTIFYDSSNNSFMNRIIKSNLQRKGNQIINANNILKQVKNDENISCPVQVRSMSSFSMIESERQLNVFMEWLAKEYFVWVLPKTSDNRGEIFVEQSQSLSNVQIDEARGQLQPRGQLQQRGQHGQTQNDNPFENVYFCHRQLSSCQTPPLNNSLEQSEKVVQKGSFKLIRPKPGFSYNLAKQASQNKEIKQDLQKDSKQYISIDSNFESDPELSARKTIPVIAQRPPLYRKANRQTTDNKRQRENQHLNRDTKQPAPFSTTVSYTKQRQKYHSATKPETHSNTLPTTDNIDASTYTQKNKDLSQQLIKLQKQIKQEQKSLEGTNRYRNSSQSSAKRQLFKLDIAEIGAQEKKSIVSWLIDINLLNSVAASYFDQLHEICKNGVIFPQIINHQKGRGQPLSYFKKPKRAAEVNSNYQKVFAYLQQQPTFHSQLLFLYQYFVPQAQEKAFWGLLLSCKNCFQRLHRTYNNNHIYTHQSAVKSKLSQCKDTSRNPESKCNSSATKKYASHSKPKQEQKAAIDLQYNKIKYGSTTEFRQKSNSANKMKSSVEFIKETPYSQTKKQGLVQIEQPTESVDKGMQGYKQLHQLKKHHSLNSNHLNTPAKKSNGNDLSMSRQRKNSNLIKKVTKSDRQQIPSVSLEMQIKASKFLTTKKYTQPLQINENRSSTLFDDPLRNGTLVNLIICKEFNSAHHYCLRPKNISDCRDNFCKAFMALRDLRVDVPSAFQCHYEEIIKGEIALFYGVVWYIACGRADPTSAETASKPANSPEEQILRWIRELEATSDKVCRLQIRDIYGLISGLIHSNLLYNISEVVLPEKYTITPTYQQPINYIEEQSNLKKILGFLTHNKVIRSSYAWKARSIVKRDKFVIFQLLNDLHAYYARQGAASDPNSISFRKYTREKMNGKKDRNERWETTMANQKFADDTTNNAFIGKNVRKESNNLSEQAKAVVIEIPWMRKLGYIGDLSLNNGVILCRLVSQLTMQSIVYNQRPQSKAECLTNLRKAVKRLQKFRWDQHQISQADQVTTLNIYKHLRQKYKNAYAMKMAL